MEIKGSSDVSFLEQSQRTGRFYGITGNWQKWVFVFLEGYLTGS
jgi:hypothetical protein